MSTPEDLRNRPGSRLKNIFIWILYYLMFGVIIWAVAQGVCEYKTWGPGSEYDDERECGAHCGNH